MTRVHLFVFDLTPAQHVQVAVEAERCGYGGVWYADHLVAPVEYSSRYPYNPAGRAGFSPDTGFPDVWALLGFLAAHTTTITLGTSVYQLPLRPPIVAARGAATVQTLSGGRLLFGVGAGWLREEFEAVGASFADRGSRMDEQIQVLRALWSGGPVGHEGTHYSFAEVQLAPAPPSPIPVVVGGTSEPALRRAARLGDGWISIPLAPADAVDHARQLQEARARLGRTDPFTCYIRPQGNQDAATVARYAEAGCTDVILALSGLGGATSFEGRLEAVAAVADACGLG